MQSKEQFYLKMRAPNRPSDFRISVTFSAPFPIPNMAFQQNPTYGCCQFPNSARKNLPIPEFSHRKMTISAPWKTYWYPRRCANSYKHKKVQLEIPSSFIIRFDNYLSLIFRFSLNAQNSQKYRLKLRYLLWNRLYQQKEIFIKIEVYWKEIYDLDDICSAFS